MGLRAALRPTSSTLALGLLAVLVLLAWSGWSATPSSRPSTSSSPPYSCCGAHFVNEVHRVGQTLDVRWTWLGGPAAAATWRLSADLVGPYPSVTALKRSVAGHGGPLPTERLQSPTLVLSGPHPEGASSHIAVPATAPAGLYELTTTVDGGHLSESAGTILRLGR